MQARDLSQRNAVMYVPRVTIRMILFDKKLYRLWQFCSERRGWATGCRQAGVSTGFRARHSDVDRFFEMPAEAAA